MELAFIKTEKFCSELETFTTVMKIKNEINLKTIEEMIKAKHMKGMFLNDNCLIVKEESKIFHFYKNGLCRFNNFSSEEEGKLKALDFYNQISVYSQSTN